MYNIHTIALPFGWESSDWLESLAEKAVIGWSRWQPLQEGVPDWVAQIKAPALLIVTIR